MTEKNTYNTPCHVIFPCCLGHGYEKLFWFEPSPILCPALSKTVHLGQSTRTQSYNNQGAVQDLCPGSLAPVSQPLTVRIYGFSAQRKQT